MKKSLEKYSIHSEGLFEGHPQIIFEVIRGEVSDGIHGKLHKKILGGISEQNLRRN